MLPNIYSILASESCCVYLRYTRCKHTHPFSVQCWVSVADHRWFNADKLSTTTGPTLLQHWVCCILSGSTPTNTCHLPNTVSMLDQCLRYRPDIETGPPAVTLDQYYSNLVPLSPDQRYNREYIFFFALFKHAIT